MKMVNKKTINFQINLKATLNKMMAKNFFVLFDALMQMVFYSQIFTLIKIKGVGCSLSSLPYLNWS